ncbi:MAG: zf-HC2 domain-containing protein [Chloroflexi bacterium]|nr:zf-HC2 domain-containing protein [Chloroflexota bacterium]MDA1173980.1 zf-HC2 domain-containing protein [Chloroflexota bacterium]
MTEAAHVLFEEMATAYAVGALSIADQPAFEEHLAGCDDCRTLISQLSAVVSELPLSVPPVQPPARLRNRVIAAVHDEASQATVAHRDSRRFMPSTARLAVAASFVLALATAGALVVWGLSLSDDVASRDGLLASSYESLSIMASADTRWEVQGTDAVPGAHGIVAYDEQTGSASLVMWGLDEDPSLRYNVWVQENGERSRVSRLYVADGGFWAVVRRDVRSLEGFGVTRIAADGGAVVVLETSAISY